MCVVSVKDETAFAGQVWMQSLVSRFSGEGRVYTIGNRFDGSDRHVPDNMKFIALPSGAVQRERVLKYLAMHPCVYRPHHQKKLGNEFLVYSNYEECQRLGGWDETLID